MADDPICNTNFSKTWKFEEEKQLTKEAKELNVLLT